MLIGSGHVFVDFFLFSPLNIIENEFVFFRLMRTVQSLMAMREPDLARVTSMQENGSSPSPVDHQNYNDLSLSLQSNNFVNSTTLPDVSFVGSSSDRGTESSNEGDCRSLYKSSSSTAETNDNHLTSLLPGARRSLDAASLNSGSSKTTEEDEVLPTANNYVDSIAKREFFGSDSRRVKKVEKDVVKIRPKPSNSVSSAEDESGFSSMSSFQVMIEFLFNHKRNQNLLWISYFNLKFLLKRAWLVKGQEFFL